MNEGHLELCSSESWMSYLGDKVVPWALDRVTLGGELLEIGPGPGAATEVLRRQVRSLTAVEYDPELARKLAERFADDPVVRVVTGDATRLDAPDARYDAAASFTMLHHIPWVAAQDAVFAEMVRVLRPGGTFFGVDSLGGPSFEAFHAGDVCLPLDPLTLADRLEAAGFADADVAVSSDGVRWIAYAPETDGARARVNERFAELYVGEDYRRYVLDDGVASLLELTDLGDDPLHLDAGPSPAVELLRAAAPRLMLAQLDPAFTDSLRDRWAGAPAGAPAGDRGVDVVTVDPTALPFPDDRFSAATVLVSLAHLRSARAQDRAMRELNRVLRPGAALVGLNAIDGSHFRSLNAGERGVPIDPLTFGERLTRAGFTAVRVDLWSFPRFFGRAGTVGGAANQDR